MARLKTLHGLMALIAAIGGRIDTRIKVQKEAYLLAATNADWFERSAFSYHYFGPYSRELSDALQFAVSSDLLTEIKVLGAADGVRYSYELTEKGRQFLSEAGELQLREASLVRLLDRHHWRALELAATVRYLQFQGTYAGRADALLDALRLKPETKAYENEASELLDKLEAVPAAAG